MEDPPVAGSELAFSDSKPAGSEPSVAIVDPGCDHEGADISDKLTEALDVVDKAWTAIENGHSGEPAATVLAEKQADEAVASNEADRSLSFTNGECCERLEIVETSPEEGQRAMESECCPAEAQDVATAPNDNEMTAAPYAATTVEDTPVECGSPCLDNGTADVDSTMPSDIISHAREDAGSPSTNDREPADPAVAEEEVDVRGMQLSENDAAEPSATGECEWTRRVFYGFIFLVLYSFLSGCSSLAESLVVACRVHAAC